MKYCNQCNLYFEDNANWCSNCGEELRAIQETQPAAEETFAAEAPAAEETKYIPYTPPAQQEQVVYNDPNVQPSGGSTTLWLVLSIITTAMCCFAFGIPAILAAVAAKKAEGRGDILLRNQKVKQARTLFIVATVVGAAFWVFYFVMVVVAAMSGEMYNY
ncbi:MAG: CD225/dispanin family protein [Christensenellales bacterium]|jgi:hypothetical protein